MLKWLYELGVKNERRRIRDGLMLRLGPRPTLDDLPDWNYKDEQKRKAALHLKQEAWSVTADTIHGYFSPPPVFEVPRDGGPHVED